LRAFKTALKRVLVLKEYEAMSTVISTVISLFYMKKDQPYDEGESSLFTLLLSAACCRDYILGGNLMIKKNFVPLKPNNGAP